MAAFRVCRFANNFHKLSHNLWKNCHQNVDKSTRLIHTATVLRLREITEISEGNVTTIQGHKVAPPPAKTFVGIEGDEKKCGLCKLDMDIKYTDVLIISQFVQDDGNIIPRQITGLCFPQHARMRKLIHQAHRAGLMQHLKPNEYPEEYSQMSNYKWKKHNAYFSELFDHDHK